jgi:hypothetical protein
MHKRIYSTVLMMLLGSLWNGKEKIKQGFKSWQQNVHINHLRHVVFVHTVFVPEWQPQAVVMF